MTAFLQITGLKEIDRKLKTLEPKIGRKIVRSSLRKAAKPVLAAAKENVPVDTGDLKASLKVRALKKRKNNYGVMVATSDGWYKGDQFYGAFVEFGTCNMPAKPFLRPAYDTQKDVAQKILITEIKTGIDEALR